MVGSLPPSPCLLKSCILIEAVGRPAPPLSAETHVVGYFPFPGAHGPLFSGGIVWLEAPSQPYGNLKKWYVNEHRGQQRD